MAELLHKKETFEIIGSCFEVYNQLGNGFLEVVYKEALQLEFDTRKIKYQREKCFDIYYKGNPIGKSYFIDFFVENEILLEVKSVSELSDNHVSQTLNYIKASGKKVGLLVNFGPKKVEYKRLVF